MDTSTAERPDLSHGGAAFGEFCLWGGVSNGLAE